MKQYLILFTFFILTACITVAEKPQLEPVTIPCVVKEVKYHGIGSDNSLQITPYWLITVTNKNSQYKIKFYTDPEVIKGDTIEIYKYKK